MTYCVAGEQLLGGPSGPVGDELLAFPDAALVRVGPRWRRRYRGGGGQATVGRGGQGGGPAGADRAGRGGAFGAEPGCFVPVFDGAFAGSSAGPGAGEPPGDARFGDDLHQPGALAVAVGLQPGVQVGGPAGVVPGMLVGGVQVDQVNRAGAGRVHDVHVLSQVDGQAGAGLSGQAKAGPVPCLG